MNLQHRGRRQVKGGFWVRTCAWPRHPVESLATRTSTLRSLKTWRMHSARGRRNECGLAPHDQPTYHVWAMGLVVCVVIGRALETKTSDLTWAWAAHHGLALGIHCMDACIYLHSTTCWPVFRPSVSRPPGQWLIAATGHSMLACPTVRL